MIKAARVDESGIYIGMDELESEAALTASHLPSITECDLPPGKYRWIADPKNPMGGAFWPIALLEFKARLDAEVAEEKAQIAFIEQKRKSGVTRRQAAVAWRKEKLKAGH